MSKKRKTEYDKRVRRRGILLVAGSAAMAFGLHIAGQLLSSSIPAELAMWMFTVCVCLPLLWLPVSLLMAKVYKNRINSMELSRMQRMMLRERERAEEAAVQGLVAGINAALKIQGKDPMILTRDTSYIGTLIDDLVTKGTEEPYRIMTSRSEYRLLHRQDNADQRLTAIGAKVGLVSPERLRQVEEKYESVRREMHRLESNGVPASKELNEMLALRDSTPVENSARLADLLRRPQVTYEDLAPFDPGRPELPLAVTQEVQIQVKYAGYLARQEKQVAEFKKEESRLLPEAMDYDSIAGLRLEARQKLSEIRPVSIGQASRISGVSPADIAVLLIYLEQNR